MEPGLRSRPHLAFVALSAIVLACGNGGSRRDGGSGAASVGGMRAGSAGVAAGGSSGGTPPGSGGGAPPISGGGAGVHAGGAAGAPTAGAPPLGGDAGAVSGGGPASQGGRSGVGAEAGLGGTSTTGALPAIPVGDNVLQLEVCTEDVIRVLYGPPASLPSRPSLAAAPKICDPMTPWQLTEAQDLTTLRTSRLEMRIEKVTGRVSFYDRAGNLIVAEKAGGHTVEAAMVQGEATHHVRQEWDANDGEALYGLGNFQQGLLNLKGYDVELSQYNTNAIVPTLVSSRGYGILWDNTSFTRFGDLREYERVPGFSYDAGGNVNGASSGAVDVEVQVTPAVTGEYTFKTFASGDVKLTVADSLVIDHWRQGWVTDEEVARVRLTAGTPVRVRLQWTADINVNTLSLLWKPPAATTTTSLWSEVGDAIDYYFLFGPESDRVIAGYRRVTGAATMLPRWAFGLFQSRERYKTAAELTAAVQGCRTRNIPVDVIVQDWQFWEEDQWGSHEFDSSRFPAPGNWIKDLHDTHHVKFMITVWPKFYTNTANYLALQQGGFTYPVDPAVKDFVGYPFVYYDAFNPGGRALFWQQIQQRLFSLGVDGWWLDATEPEVVEGPYTSLANSRALYTTHMHPTALGSGSRMLNAYSLVNSQGIYEGQRAAAADQRVFILTRSAFAGQQRYASSTWSGDITSTWTSLKKQIAGGLGFSISGIPYWTVDSGGFAVPTRFTGGQNATEWQELNARWFQYATFLPLLRVHGQTPNRELWEFGGESSAAYQAMLKFDRLRYRMLPYVYSLAGAVTHRASTMLRPLVMDFRTDMNALDVKDQFMFGPALLVSPVTTYRATSRSVYLPQTAGGWYDFWTGATVAGGANANVMAPLDRIPVHVRAGSIIPFGPELAYTSEKPADPLTLYVYAGADGGFELYEDDGTSYAYEKGAFARVPITWSDSAKTLTLGAREGSFTGMLATRTIDLVLVTPSKAVGWSFTPTADKSVKYDGAAQAIPLP